MRKIKNCETKEKLFNRMNAKEFLVRERISFTSRPLGGKKVLYEDDVVYLMEKYYLYKTKTI